MKTYRIFCQDAGRKYTALREVRASDAREAERKMRGRIDIPIKAIEWPPTAHGEAWLKKNLPPIPKR